MGFEPPASAKINNAIYNGSPEQAKLEWLHFYWPDLNGKLEWIELGGSVIWDDGAPPPMVEIFSFKGNSAVSEFSVENLTFYFQTGSEPSGYFVEATFEEIGCYISDGY